MFRIFIYDMEDDDIIILEHDTNKNSDVKLIKSIEKIFLFNKYNEIYANRLTKYCIVVIKRIMKTNPEFFLSIEEIVKRSIEKNKIESSDIHNIISIITNFYNILIVMNKILVGANSGIKENANLTCIMIGFILKFFFRICIQDNTTPFDSNMLIIEFNNIINGCIKLLELKEQKIIKLIGESKYYDYEGDEDDYSEYYVPVAGNQCCCFF
jgi:hypothetical protein